jgi:hypothetical protein
MGKGTSLFLNDPRLLPRLDNQEFRQLLIE